MMWEQSLLCGRLGLLRTMADYHATTIPSGVPGSDGLKLQAAEGRSDRGPAEQLGQRPSLSGSVVGREGEGTGATPKGIVRGVVANWPDGGQTPTPGTSSAGSTPRQQGAAARSASTSPGKKKDRSKSYLKGYAPSGFHPTSQACVGETRVHHDMCKWYGTNGGQVPVYPAPWALKVRGRHRYYIAAPQIELLECCCREYLIGADYFDGSIKLKKVSQFHGMTDDEFYFVTFVPGIPPESTANAGIYREDGLWTLTISDELRRWMDSFIKHDKEESMYIPLSVQRHLVVVKADVGVDSASGVRAMVTLENLPSAIRSDGVPIRLGIEPGLESRVDEVNPNSLEVLYPHRVHMGDHSISGDGCQPFVVPSAVTSCNVIRWAVDYITANSIGVAWTGNRSGVQITSSISGVVGEEQARTSTIVDGYTYWAKNPQKGRISNRRTRQVGTLDLTQVVEYRGAGATLDTKKVESQLASLPGMNGNTAKVLSPLLLTNIGRTDNSSLYAKGFLLLFMRQSMDDQPAYPKRWRLPGASIVGRNWSDGNINQLVQTDLENRRFMLDAEALTAENINCIKHLARAGPPLAPTPGEYSPTLAAIDWFAIPFTLLHIGDWPDLDSIRDFNPAEMYQTLLLLGKMRREQDQLAAGFVRACVYFNTKVHKYDNGTTFTTYATGEAIQEVEWITPSSHNFTWDMMDLNLPDSEYTLMTPPGEHSAIYELGVSNLIRVSAAIAGLVSLGIGLHMNQLNITGRVLNRMCGDEERVEGLKVLASEYFQPDSAICKGVSPVFARSMVEIRSHTGVDIPETIFHGVPYSAGFRNLSADPRGLWERAYGFRTPYTLSPLCMAAFMHKWPCVFGLYTGNVTMDLKCEAQPNATPPGWYVAQGDAGYSAMTLGVANAPRNVYIPYGLAVMNAAMQAMEVPHRINFAFQKFGPDLCRHAFQVPMVESDPLTDLDWLPSIGIYKPGSVRSYDWEEGCNLAPVIPKLTISEALWSAVYANRYVSGVRRAGVVSQMLAPVRMMEHAPIRFGLDYLEESGYVLPSGVVPPNVVVPGNADGPLPPAPVVAAPQANP